MAVIERNSKEAISHFRVLERFRNYTYLEVKLGVREDTQIGVIYPIWATPSWVMKNTAE